MPRACGPPPTPTLLRVRPTASVQRAGAGSGAASRPPSDVPAGTFSAVPDPLPDPLPDPPPDPKDVPAGTSRGLRRGRRYDEGPAQDLHVESRDRAPVHRLVAAVERFAQGRRVLDPLGEVDADLVALAHVAHVGARLLAGGRPRRPARDHGHGLRPHLVERLSDDGGVEARQPRVAASHDLVGDGGEEEAHGRPHPRVGGDEETVHLELVRQPRGVDGRGASEGDQRAARHPFPPLDRVRARGVGHVLVHHLADAEGREPGVEPELVPHAGLDRGLGPSPVEGDRAPGEEFGIDPPEDDIGVRHRGRVPAPAVRRRPRLRPGARGPHLDPLEVVHPGDRPAPGPDLDHLDHGDPYGQSAPLLEAVAAGDLERPRMERPPAIDDAQLGRRPAHVEGEDVAQFQRPREMAGEDRAPGGSGFHQADGSRDRRLERREPAARGHEKEGTREARLAERIREPPQVAGHERLDVGVRAGRRLSLVLPHLGAHVRGQRHRQPRPPFVEDLPDPPLVVRVRVAVDEPHRDGLHPLRLERREKRAHRAFLQRHEDAAAVVDPLLHRQPKPPRDEGRGTVDADVVLLKTVLVRHLEGVAVPRRDDEGGAGAPALDDGVRGQRRAVDDETDGGGRNPGDPQHLVHPLQNPALRRRGGREHLRRDEAPAGLQRHIREGPADVDGEPRLGHGSPAHPPFTRLRAAGRCSSAPAALRPGRSSRP